jgi:hypothetical protein
MVVQAALQTALLLKHCLYPQWCVPGLVSEEDHGAEFNVRGLTEFGTRSHQDGRD